MTIHTIYGAQIKKLADQHGAKEIIQHIDADAIYLMTTNKEYGPALLKVSGDGPGLLTRDSIGELVWNDANTQYSLVNG